MDLDFKRCITLLVTMELILWLDYYLLVIRFTVRLVVVDHMRVHLHIVTVHFLKLAGMKKYFKTYIALLALVMVVTLKPDWFFLQMCSMELRQMVQMEAGLFSVLL